MKWDMGWMHDTLEYFKQDPIGRRYHHHKLTFRSMYFWSENFVLPLSHDEVVHGKRSLIERMPGDLWRRFANLRAMYGMMWAQPGKKLLFQGGEFGQYKEWAFDASLDWNLLGETAFHAQLMAYVTELNRLYRSYPALHAHDVGLEGFEWIDANDAENSVYSFFRRGKGPRDVLVAVFNCTPIPRYEYRIGMPSAGSDFVGRWKELLNSDSEIFGGSGLGNLGVVDAERFPCHGRDASVRLTLPPLSALYFVPE
jgi:1,4-alpha-glucan branching enzyme